MNKSMTPRLEALFGLLIAVLVVLIFRLNIITGKLHANIQQLSAAAVSLR